MRFLADESLERPVVDRLRDEGCDVAYVAEIEPGSKDEQVLRSANRSARILITNDKDFAALAFLQRRASTGIVLLRMPRSRSLTKARRLLEVVRAWRPRLQRAFTVIDTSTVRRRPLPRPR